MQQSSPPNNGEAFRRADNLLAVENEDRDERARQALSRSKTAKPADPPSSLTDDSDALTRRITGDQRGDDDNVDSTANLPQI